MKREEAREYAMMALMACEGIASVHLCEAKCIASRYPIYNIYAIFNDGSKRWLCFSNGCHYESFPSLVHIYALSEDDGEDDIWKCFAECYLIGEEAGVCIAPRRLMFIDVNDFIDDPH